MATSEERLEVAVVGGGQAGLAMGYHLTKRGARFAIFDASPEVGYSWRNRWDSLALFTSARFSSLPGLRFPAPDDHYPSKEEVARYLKAYAASFKLPVLSGSEVLALRQSDDGYLLETNGGVVRADQVIVATGPFQQPAVPAFSEDLSTDVIQLHSARYARPADIPSGDVLVVGGGNSGFQIATELAGVRHVSLSVGRRLIHLPQRPLGMDLFWWLTRLGVMRVRSGSPLGRFFRTQPDAIVGTPLGHARELGVRIMPRAIGARRDAVDFADGSARVFRAVVWATGYRSDYAWIRMPVIDAAGRPIHHGGISPARGLFFMGLPWQRTAGSALLGFVGSDAQFVAEHLS